MKESNHKLRATMRRTTDPTQQQFRRIVQQMAESHDRTEINFNEFMLLLARFNLKFSSPQQFKKMSRLFNNTFHCLPTRTPFEYLELHSKHTASDHNYYLIRILHKKVDIFFNDTRNRNTHPVQKCMTDLVLMMKRRYGNESNWFKVLGGLTVSVSIQAEMFRVNLQHVLRNTSHYNCTEGIVELFAQERVIRWTHFMQVAKAHLRTAANAIKTSSKKSFQRNSSIIKEKEPELSEPYLTVKSKFFKAEQEGRPSCQSLRKGSTFTRSEYGSRRWTEGKNFLRSRCHTQGPEQQSPLLHQSTGCPKAKTSVSLTQSSELAYPVKKHTISLPVDDKRMQRNHFLWKYLKEKLQLA